MRTGYPSDEMKTFVLTGSFEQLLEILNLLSKSRKFFLVRGKRHKSTKDIMHRPLRLLVDLCVIRFRNRFTNSKSRLTIHIPISSAGVDRIAFSAINACKL